MEKFPKISSIEEAQEYIESLTDNEYTISGGNYDLKGNSMVEFIHLKCGNVFTARFKELRRSYIKSHGGCPKCANKRRAAFLSPKLDMDNFKEKIQDFPGSEEFEILSTEYIDNKTKILFKHKVCGNDFLMRPNDFQQGYRCPHCSRTVSKKEMDMYEYIKEIYPGEVEKSNRSMINPFELDIYIPDKKIAIEFNGLFWHSEKMKGKNYHKQKLELCTAKGIRLVQIFEDE